MLGQHACDQAEIERPGVADFGARISLAQAGEEKPKMPRRIFWQMFGRYALLGLVLYVMLLRFYWPVVAFLFGLFSLFAAVLLEVIGELVFGTRGGMPA